MESDQEFQPSQCKPHKKRKQTGTRQEQGSMRKRWAFTINNYDETDINRLEQTAKDTDQFALTICSAYVDKFCLSRLKILWTIFRCLNCTRLVIRLFEICEKGQTESLQLAETKHFYWQIRMWLKVYVLVNNLAVVPNLWNFNFTQYQGLHATSGSHWAFTRNFEIPWDSTGTIPLESQ